DATKAFENLFTRRLQVQLLARIERRQPVFRLDLEHPRHRLLHPPDEVSDDVEMRLLVLVELGVPEPLVLQFQQSHRVGKQPARTVENGLQFLNRMRTPPPTDLRVDRRSHGPCAFRSDRIADTATRPARSPPLAALPAD